MQLLNHSGGCAEISGPNQFDRLSAQTSCLVLSFDHDLAVDDYRQGPGLHLSGDRHSTGQLCSAQPPRMKTFIHSFPLAGEIVVEKRGFTRQRESRRQHVNQDGITKTDNSHCKTSQTREGDRRFQVDLKIEKESTTLRKISADTHSGKYSFFLLKSQLQKSTMRLQQNSPPPRDRH